MKTSTIRKPAVAGMFYPEDGGELHVMVQQFLSEGHAAKTPPRALIAPHAGFVFSGAVAGSAFASWIPMRGVFRRVVVAGPSHRLAFKGIAVSDVEYFATPLGLIPVDPEMSERLHEYPQVVRMDAAHRHEHSVETHLPFLQETLGEFSLVPLVIGNATPRDVAQVLNLYWDDPHTAISISSDLSHYLPYAEAMRMDAATSRAIEENHPHDIGPDQACGRLGILGILHVAARHHLSAKTLDLRNSGDTGGDRDRVVGYGAYAIG